MSIELPAGLEGLYYDKTVSRIESSAGKDFFIFYVCPAETANEYINLKIIIDSVSGFDRIYSEGNQSWSCSRIISLSGLENKEKIKSKWCIGIERADRCFVIGPGEFPEYDVDFEVEHLNISLTVTYGNKEKGYCCKPEEIELIIFEGNNLDRTLKKYSEYLKKKENIVFKDKLFSGWCSWYYYFWNITEEKIERNLRFLQESDIKGKIDYFQIDDGYQKKIGDWFDTGENFPKGMKYLASEIRESGFIPGLWVAPFIAEEGSLIIQKHPEYILRDLSGNFVFAAETYQRKTYCLDISRKDVLEYIKNFIKKIVFDWGYKFLKLDFLFAGMTEGCYSNRKSNPAVNYRNALKIIKETAGDDVIMLGCGAPIYPSIGYFDCMRISPDVAPYWKRENSDSRSCPSAFNAVVNNINRIYMHKNFWINDPDCLMVRKTDTELKPEEINFIKDVIRYSGGMVVVSDDMTKLNEDDFKVIKKSIENSGTCGEPLSYKERDKEYFMVKGKIINKGEERIINLDWDRRVTEIKNC